METDNNSMSGKTVLVTGGAGALGKGVATWFVERGAHVAIIDYSEALISSSFPQAHANMSFVVCDLTKRESCAEAVTKIQQDQGRIDVLANIAGGFMMGDPVHETTDETWGFLFNLNARSVMNMAAATVPLMKAQGSGKIINVAARAALAGAAMMGSYTASKAAVMRLTESMALELREDGINVNAVMPSLIDTERNRQDMPEADYSKWVTPAQLAGVIGFLASSDASAVHGACIPVDGLS